MNTVSVFIQGERETARRRNYRKNLPRWVYSVFYFRTLSTKYLVYRFMWAETKSKLSATFCCCCCC